MANNVALVLGAGGSAGQAWQVGVIAGLAEAGLDLTEAADLVIGTSSGSTTAAWVRSGRRIDVEPSGVRFSIPEPPGLEMNLFQSAPAISPDGRIIAFFASNIVRGSIWLHHLDSTRLQELPETEGAISRSLKLDHCIDIGE